MFWNVNQSCHHTFHNVLGTLWARFVGHFEKYFYLFIQLSHIVRGICLPEVEHKISQWNGLGITFYFVNFSKAYPDMIYAEFPILQKGCHNIVNIVALLYVVKINYCCHNVVEMFSYNVLRQHCGNVLVIFLEYVAAT